MGLNEDMFDLFKVHDAGLVADGFDERARHRLRVRRNKPSPARTMSASASGVKVL